MTIEEIVKANSLHFLIIKSLAKFYDSKNETALNKERGNGLTISV